MNHRYTLGLIAVASLALSACHRHHQDTAATRSQESAAATAALPFSAKITAANAASAIVSMNQLEIAPADDAVVLRASGNDPQVAFKVNSSVLHPCAVRVDLTVPSDTIVELFYEAGDGTFSADHVARFAAATGRNVALVQVGDPQFTGGLRLDPGQAPGEYRLHTFEVYSSRPVRFAQAERPQDALAADFNAACSTVVWQANSPDAFSSVKVVGDGQGQPTARGLEINATGNDPRLTLPSIPRTTRAIAKVTLTSPTATALQIFYKNASIQDFDEANSATHAVPAGDSTTYLPIDAPQGATDLRLDPGTVPGLYIIKEIEVRSCDETRAP